MKLVVDSKFKSAKQVVKLFAGQRLVVKLFAGQQ